MVTTGSRSTRFVSPFTVLFTVGLLLGAVLGMLVSRLFGYPPIAMSYGVWLLSFGIAETVVALLGAQLAREALWLLLLVGQALGIVGLLVCVAAFVA